MIKELQEIFPSLILKSNMLDDENYQWYMTSENEVIGIKKSELTEQAALLLGKILTPYNIHLPELTEQEQEWINLIKTNNLTTKIKTDISYRFICFSYPKNKLDPVAFKEAINEIFTKQMPILWENEYSGIIVEERSYPYEEAISYEQIIDVLMSDLYVKINFLVGPYFHQLNEAKNYYHVLLKGAKTAFLHSEKKVLSYIEAIPYIFTDKAGPDFQAIVADMILKEAANDAELLHTIETFIDCNLNISVTAKELFMHRNSLQYRIEKFNEKTGIDIRNFHHAITVHLALLSKNLKTKA